MSECLICFSEDTHCTFICPYLDRVPENAVVRSGCDVVCRKCGYTMKRPGKWICCKQEGRAVLKKCEINQQYLLLDQSTSSSTAMDSDEDGLNSDGTKAEEPKYGVSLHKRHKYPGSKDHKATSSKRQKFALGAPAGKCLICLAEEGKHYTVQCPYLKRVPENAVVGSGCDVVCRKCGYTIKRPGKWICCKEEGRAVLKKCEICMTSGEHWSVECPSDEGVELARTLLTPIENLSCEGVTGPLV